MADHRIEISVRGKWVTVPALGVNGHNIVVRGRWLKVASVDNEEWLEIGLDAPERYFKALKAQGPPRLHADIFTFTQKLPATMPHYPYHMELDSVAAVRTNRFREWWERLPQESRKNVRRAQKRGVRIAIEGFGDHLIKGIMSVNNESPTRQGRPNDHYGKTFGQVQKDYGSFPDRCDFICAYLGDELIGFLKIVYRGNIASILNLAAKPGQYDKRPTNALVAKAVELCEARGIAYLTYGLLNYGNKRHGTLRQFKIRNGFEEILMPRYYVPLTQWGALAVKLRLHRGAIGIFPNALLQIGLAARARLYNIKQSLSRCSSMLEQPNGNRPMERSTPPAGSNL